MNTRGGRNADQSSKTINVWAANRPPEQDLSLCDWVRSERTSSESIRLSLERWSLGMDRPERLSAECTRLEVDCKSLGSCILDFYPSTSSITPVKISEFEDRTVARHSELLQLERSYGLDPVAIFNKVTKDEIKQLAPEQNITLFALRLALIEKLASGIGTLSFIWASTILLGGFASNLNPVDFIVITLVLVTEGTRIISRSRELEWQHLASKSTQSSLAYQTARSLKISETCGSGHLPKSRGASGIAEGQDPSNRVKLAKTVLGIANVKNIRRTWSGRLVRILPRGWRSIISTRGVSAILFWIQITSGVVCLPLSIWRLSRQEYNPPVVSRQNSPVNLYTSLNVFYILALTEALLFLLERVYWDYKINYEQLLVQMTNKADLGEGNQEMMKQFFYEVYKKCIDGSVFDGLTMDIVEYSLTLLGSDNSFEKLRGLTVLRKIIDRYYGFSLDALRRTGAAPGVIERLAEMLSWSGNQQDEIRLAVAALICQLVRYSKNCFRVAAVPGAIEGIVSLLRPHERDRVQFTVPSLDTATDRLYSERAIALRLDGLHILVALARDPVSLLKIGETRGLIPILLAFIAIKNAHAFGNMEGSELKSFKKALRLLKMLSAARNTRGPILGPVIVRVLSGIASMRDILEFGDSHPKLQWMAIEILNNLALDDDIRRRIGSTGGVIRNLLTLYSRNLDSSTKTHFVSDKDKKAEIAVSKRAGDALNLLATKCRKNCLRMMDLQDGNGKKTFIPTLLRILNEHREQTICAAKILRSLLEYGSYSHKREIADCITRVLRLIMGSSSQRMHEAALGLASRVVLVLDEQTYNQAIMNLDRIELVWKLLRNLEYCPHGSNYRLPRIRRHSIELIIALINRDPTSFAEFMRDDSLEKKLVQTLDTICEAEDFVIFSGAEGLTRHAIAMEDLVQHSIDEVRMLDQEREQIPLRPLGFGVLQLPKSEVLISEVWKYSSRA